MTLKNTANYHNGENFLFLYEGKEVGFNVIRHVYKGIELKRLDNGFVKIYTLDELSPANKNHQQKFKKSLKSKIEDAPKNDNGLQKTLAEIHSVDKNDGQKSPVQPPKPEPVAVVKVDEKTVQKTEKPAPKVATKTETPDEKLPGFKPHAPVFLNGQWVDYWEHQHWLFLGKLRKVLNSKGFVTKVSPGRLLDIIEENILEKE